MGERIDVEGSRRVRRPSSRRQRGRISDKALLKIVRTYPGLSMYELGQRLSWKTGHVDGAVRRLLNSKKVMVRSVSRTGRNVNLVYPRRRVSADVVQIPKKLLTPPNPAWHDEAFIYALSSSTIGISPEDISEWKNISCFRGRVKLSTKGNRVSLKIPEDFVRFYDMRNRHRIVSVSGNDILVTVSGDLIQSKKYPS